MSEPFDLETTFIHLGLGGTSKPLPDFEWSEECMTAYRDDTVADGPDGRMVCLLPMTETWTGWERHPAGEEVVVLISGRATLFQELDGASHAVELRPGQAVINPAGVWHTTDVHEPGSCLFITPGLGTEHRPR